jgi:uncharacterized caspase-like protein
MMDQRTKTRAAGRRRFFACLAWYPIVFILVLLHSTPGHAIAGATAERPRAALVIGNGNYLSVPQLRNPGNDARDMCAALRNLGYNTACYTDIKTKIQFRALVQDFADKISPDTVLILYYAGHAVQINGENYLVPVQADLKTESAVADQSLSLGYVMRQLQFTRAFLKIVIIDACRDDPLKSAPSLVANMPQINIMDFPDDSFLLYATAANQVALDGQGRNGALTKNLLKYIRDDGDLNDLFNRVSDGVKEETTALGHPQSPEIRRNSTVRYCFVKCTSIEDLQAKQDAAAQKIAELQARVAAGDKDAKALLDAEIKKRDKEAAKNAKDTQKKSFVPPAF